MSDPMLEADVRALKATDKERRQVIHELRGQMQRLEGAIAIVKSMHDLHIQNGQKIDAIVARNVEADRSLEKLLSGFPDGDAEKHREYHESIIEFHKLRNEILRTAIVKMGQGGIFACAAWLGWLIWKAFKLQVTQ